MNRDESFSRETAPLQFWSDDGEGEGWFGGRDLAKGGTWLGINKKGRWVALTNILTSFQPPQALAYSRGSLPLALLSQKDYDPEEWINLMRAIASPSISFNIVFGSLKEDHRMYLYCSEDASNVQTIDLDEVKCISLANRACYECKWPKEGRGEELLQHLNETEENLPENLFNILRDEEDFASVSNEFPKNLPIFVAARPISSDLRGTVSSSIIMFDGDQVEMRELTWNSDGSLKNEAKQVFFVEH